MKIIQRYILIQILSVFVMCLIVFTFVLFIGNMLRIIEVMSKGVGITIIVRFLMLLLPFMLAYSIPMSILTSVLLIFAKLSADNEITAIRSSGINLKRIFNPVIICTFIMVPFCYFLNDNMRPNAIFASRKLLLEIGIHEPAFSLSAGKFNEIFPGYVIYVGQRQGKRYKYVIVYTFEDDKLNNVISAESGRFEYEDNRDIKGSIIFKLNKGVIEEIPQEEHGTGKQNRIQFETYSIVFNMQDKLKDLSKLTKKEREMTNIELVARIKGLRNSLYQNENKSFSDNILQEISCIKTRIHNRIALSFSCFIFVLVGIPLGIRVHRSETSIGAGISLILVASYYFLMTLGEAFQNNAKIHPWIFMWVPNAVLFCFGIGLLYKLLKK